MRTSFKLPFRWLLLAVWLLCGLSVPLRAEHVSTEDARRAAFTFLQACGARCNSTAELTDVSEALGFSHLYAFNGSKGYVVLAADNSVCPVLCFSPEGHLDAAHLPGGMRSFLHVYEEAVSQAVEQGLRISSETARQWNDLIEGRTESFQTRESAGPLLSTKWGQEDPFNLQCPMNTEAGMRCTTGSVATAMAQIMKYWEHPKQGKGSHDDYAGDNLYLYGYDSLTANFGETTYDWQHMRNRYGTLTFATDEEKQAVAELMFHCAVSVDMIFDYDGNTFTVFDPDHRGSHLQSNASYYKVGNALKNNFYYKCPSYQERSDYSDEQWMQMIRDALTATPPRPIHVIMEHAYMYTQYIGYSFETIGYVCDGYKNTLGNDYIHINWGTDRLVNSGSFNEGYFRIDGFQFPGYDKAYFGIEPDSANITITKNHDWGTVTSGGCFPKGDLITLQAVPYNGRHFSRWTKNGTFVSSSPEFTVKVDADATYTAEFDPDQIHVTVVVEPDDGGTATGTGIYSYDTECHFHAEPNVGYAFLGWYELIDGSEYCWTTNPDFTQLVHYDKTVTARFATTNYTVNLTPVPFLFSGTVSGAGTYPANSSVTVTATPLGNHQFMGWVENGAIVSSNSNYTFTLQSDRNLLAIFGNGTQSDFGDIGSVVTNADGSQGVLFHIDPSGVGWMVAMNDVSEGCPWGPEINIDALPDYPCNNMIALGDLSGLMNTGILRTTLGTDNDYAASQVDFYHGWYLPSAGQLRKLYAALPFVDSVLYHHGGNTISEDTYWSSTEYSTSDAATPMFAMSNSTKGTNHRVRAIRNYFSPQDNMILAMPDSPTRGTVMNYHNGIYTYGEQAAVVANPKAGYVFDHWSEEGLPVSYNNVYTFTFTHSRQLIAHFVVSGSVGTVVHNADGSDGVVFYVDTDGTEGLMVALEDASEGCPWGPDVNIDALPDMPCNNILVLEDMVGFQNTGIIRNAQGIDSLYAANVVDYDHGWYLPSAGQLRKLYAALPMIESALVRAGGSPLAEDAYWSSTEYSSSDAHCPMFAMGNSNKSASLRVRAIRSFLTSGAYSIVVKSNDTLMGTVTGSGVYELNATVTVSAQAKPGYVFDHWSEEGLLVSSEAQYQFPFIRNRTLVANFIVAGAVGSIVHNADGSKGVVFYLNQEGTEGWMVALQDASDGCAWGPTTNIQALPDHPCNNILALEDLSGYANTSVIRKVQGTDNGYAANVVDFDNGWYLPSSGQMRKLYAALPMIEQALLDAGGTTLTEDAYWSSTEYNSSNACSPMFAMSNTNKTSLLRVRAVRTFNCSSTNMIRVKSNNLAFGGVAGGGNFELGATVSVMATPNTNYVFDHWEEDGCVVSHDQLYTFTFTRTRTLMAVFVRENSIGSVVHNTDGTTGVIFYTYPSGIGGLMVALEDVSEGCTWGLNEDITIMDNQSPSAVMDLLNDMCGKSNTNRIREWYSGNTNYAACKPDFANGWYLPSAGQLRKLYAALPLIERAIVDAGGTTLTEDAYWSSTEQSASKAWTPMFAMSSTNKTSNCRVRAIRSLTDTKTILANVNIEGAGTVVGTGLYDYGQPCTLKAQANNTYAFLNWTCGGSVVSTNMEYSFTVMGNQTYTANFVANSCNITTAMDPANSGTVTGAGVYAIGTTCVLSATPNTGYTFSNWTKGNNQVSTQSSYSFTVTESAQYTAHFVINSYAVNATAFPEEGGTVSGAQTYTHGSTATLTATPAEGYTFVNWTENGVVVSTSSTYQFVVSGNRTLQANFSNNVYTISAIVYPENGGTVIGAGVYEYGTVVTLTAIANFGYEFFCWFEDNDMVSFEPTVSFEVTENVVVYAVFVENNTVTQTTTLSAGWNWFSANVEITLDDLKAALVEALPGTNIKIKSQSNGSISYNGNTWRGALNSLDVSQMYMIKVSTGCEITLTGTPINPAEHPVTIYHGVNWIAFPLSQSMTLSEAFAGFAVSGDKVKSQTTTGNYNGTLWRPSFSLVPGQGYMYISNTQGIRTFTFPANSK